MKKRLFLYTAILGLGVMLFSCEKDETKAVINVNVENPQIIGGGGFNENGIIVITPAKLADTIYFKYITSDFGFPASTINIIEMVKDGGDFSQAIEIGRSITQVDSIVVGVDALNNAIMGLQADPTAPVTTVVQIRMSTLLVGDSSPMYSDTIKVSITPYAVPIVWSYLYVAGNFQGWSPSTADFIKSPSNGVYEGYINMGSGADANFKFCSKQNWDGPNYGLGATAGTVSSSGGDISLLAATGTYYFKVNLNTLTYTTTSYNVGLVGDATPNGWASPDTKMTYDNAKDVWKVTANLTAGKFKFRLNDDWGTNWGGDINNLINSGSDIDIPATGPGNYTITLNLKKAPFKCTLVKN